MTSANQQPTQQQQLQDDGGGLLRRRRQLFDEGFDDGGLEELEEFADQPRIIGGQDARQDRWPWFVQIRGPDENGGIGACGGSLIAPDIVLSAAHCDTPNSAIIGPYNLDNVQGGNRVVVESVRHPLYAERIDSLDYDIMISKIDRVHAPPYIRLNFDPNVPSETGEPLIMLGYGSTTDPDPANPVLTKPRILQEASTRYVTNDDCSDDCDPTTGACYGFGPDDTRIDPHWFCTLETTPVQTGTCFGDSGGPIALEGSAEDGSVDVLMAVISGASGGCGNPYLPLWNQRVSFHAPWILQEGCRMSVDPPAEWNCDQGGVVPASPVSTPTAAPIPPTPQPVVVVQPTSSPTLPPTRIPTRSPTRVPTPAPTPAPVTIAPVPSPTLPPSTAMPILTPMPTTANVTDDDTDTETPTTEPTWEPTPEPTVSPAPSITAQPTIDEVYQCNVCGDNRTVTSPNSTVVVPLMGRSTCGELQIMADEGQFNRGQCMILHIVTAPCRCEILEGMIAPSPAPIATLPPNGLPTLQPISLVENSDVDFNDGNDGDEDEQDDEDENDEDEDNDNGDDVPEECQFLLATDAALVPVTVNIQFDDSPVDIGWFLADAEYACYRVGIPSGTYEDNTSAVTETLLLVGGVDYMFVIEDDVGNGLGGGSDGGMPGSYTVTADNGSVVLASGGGNFGSEEQSMFTTPER